MVRFAKKKRSSRTLLISAAVFLAVLLGFLWALNSVSAGTNRRQRESLEKALDRCIAWCYAVEGAYPDSLSYMKEHYGLRYDEEHFFVDYHSRGGNMLPDVTILEKGS